MPICNHEEFNQLLRKGKRCKFRDDDEKIFYCNTTKRIFRYYEDYALQVLAISATIWKCSITGCENLTYSEALNSEKLALQNKCRLNENLRPVVLIFIKTVKQVSLKNLCSLSYEFVRSRFFKNERIRVLQENQKYTSFIVTNVKPKSTMFSESDYFTYKPHQVEYAVKNDSNGREIIVQFEQMKRYRNSLTFNNLKDFIEQNVITLDGILHPTPKSYKKYVTDKKLSYDKIFVGEIPCFYIIQKEKFVKENTMILSRKTDDLERLDQKLLLKFENVNTIIPIEYFGDVIMLSEFLHSFSKILSSKSVLTKNITLSELTRAFTTREIDGPLSKILIHLLQTIFNLQKKEESEYLVKYTSIQESKNEFEPFKTMNEAYKTHEYVSSHFFSKLNELPLNVNTLSEILRLHFLASGAQVNNATEMFRQMYRNGYSSTEDPGLMFRMEEPHIVDFLETMTVHQLSKLDIFKIINTLIGQILSYSSVIGMIEKQMHRIVQLKNEIKTTRLIKKQHNKKIQTRLSSKENFKIKKLSQSLFGFKAYLGMDRAYRKYYVLRSIPGVFVEHPLDCIRECLQNPPKNIPSFVNHPKQKYLIERYLTKIYNNVRRNQQKGNEDIQNNNNNNSNNQPSQSNYNMEIIDTEETNLETTPTQYELMMCTGIPTNCIVHDVNNLDRQRWAYFYKEEHIDAVIQSLNPLGERESILKKNLSLMRELIVEHVRNCPVDNLSLNAIDINKIATTKEGSTEDCDLNEELYAKLLDQMFKLGNHIKACNLKANVNMQRNTIGLRLDPSCGDKLTSAHKDFSMPNEKDFRLRECVRNVSLSLLHMKQSINKKYLSEKDLQKWETSLMCSTSYSQVFLHLNILDRVFMWSA